LLGILPGRLAAATIVVAAAAIQNLTFGALPVRAVSFHSRRHEIHPAPPQTPTTNIINRAASLPLQLKHQLIVAAAAAATELYFGDVLVRAVPVGTKSIRYHRLTAKTTTNQNN